MDEIEKTENNDEKKEIKQREIELEYIWRK